MCYAQGGAENETGGTSDHISLTFSRIMLQCRSKAFTRPKSFLLFRQLMSTCQDYTSDQVRGSVGEQQAVDVSPPVSLSSRCL